MKRYRLVLCFCMSLAALAMPDSQLFAQQFWKTCWSPDGAKIAFGDGADIWMIDAEGGIPENLTKNIADDSSCPAFSPDGKKVCFSVVHEFDDDSILCHTSDVCAINITTGEIRTVFENAYAVSFSSDGRYATYIKDKCTYAVYDFETKKETVFGFSAFDPPYFCGGHSSMSPDNRYFISRFEYGNNTFLHGKYKIYRVAIDSGEAELIDICDYNQIYPKYSPDGEKILFSQACANGVYKLTVYSFSSGTATQIDNNDMAETICGSWSPDGGKICYIRNKGDVSALFIYDITSGDKWCIHSKLIEDATFVEETAPAFMILRANYPNPFNPSTTIPFVLEGASEIALDVFNIAGQNIRRLYQGHMNRGSHSIVWDGRDDSGNAVSSGIYISRLTTGERVATRQMMLVR